MTVQLATSATTGTTGDSTTGTGSTGKLPGFDTIQIIQYYLITGPTTTLVLKFVKINKCGEILHQLTAICAL